MGDFRVVILLALVLKSLGKNHKYINSETAPAAAAAARRAGYNSQAN